MKRSVPKSHHYVPQVYLRRFTDSQGFLRVLDHKRGQMRRQIPKEVMRIDAYYRQVWAPAGIDPNVLEKRLAAGIEADIKEVLDCLCDTPARLSGDQASNLLAYMEPRSNRRNLVCRQRRARSSFEEQARLPANLYVDPAHRPSSQRLEGASTNRIVRIRQASGPSPQPHSRLAEPRGRGP